MTSRFRSDAFWSSTGTLAPIVVGALATPVLLSALGAHRFAIYALCFAIVSFAPSLDLGVSKTAFRRIAAARSTEPDAVPSIAALALRSSWMCGIAVALVLGGALVAVSLFAGADWIPESAAAALALALVTVPPAIVGNTQRAILEGAGRFEASAGIRITLGVLTAVVPLLLCLATRNVLVLVFSVLLLRVATVLAQQRILHVDELARAPAASVALPRVGAVSFREESAWFGLAAVVSLLMSGFDRFVVLALTNLTLVDLAVLIAPQEVALKATILPAAFVPALMVRIATDDGSTHRKLLSRSLFSLSGLVFLGCLTVSIVASVIAEYIFPLLPKGEVILVIQILAFGVFSNAVAQFPAAVLNARGMSRTYATLQLAELPLFLLAVPVLVHEFNAAGAAMAWSLRAVVDAFLLLECSARRAPDLRVRGWNFLHFGGLILLGIPLILG